jgi:hypothetical protein
MERRKATKMKGFILFLIFIFSSILPTPLTYGGDNIQKLLDLMDVAQRQKEQRDQAIIRPLLEERTAIQELLDISPPPKTLIPADRQFLQELLGKVVWTGLERRVMHTIYKEVHGQDIDLPSSTQGINK